MAVTQGQWNRLSKECLPPLPPPPHPTPERPGLTRDSGEDRPYSRIFNSRAIWQRAQGRQKVRVAQSCPTEPWRVGKGEIGRGQGSQVAGPQSSVPAVLDWSSPGCGSAPACPCAESAGPRAGTAHSSTPRSRQRCDRRGTGERKCRIDLDRAGRSGSGCAALAPGEGTDAEGIRVHG